MQHLQLPGSTPEMWDKYHNIGMKLLLCVNVYLNKYLIYENAYVTCTSMLVYAYAYMCMYICRSVYMYNYALSKSIQGNEKNVT